MIYLDTNIIISFVDKNDALHRDAITLLNKLKEKKVASDLVFLELVSVYSRAGIDDPTSWAIYSLRITNTSIISQDLNVVVKEAARLAPLLKLKTLDLLHVAACRTMGISKMATFDKEIQAKACVIKKLGIEIIPNMCSNG